jgi:alpha-D-ribose 1-methylphosphonate 5-triphosphate diphosphatase PhnM
MHRRDGRLESPDDALAVCFRDATMKGGDLTELWTSVEEAEEAQQHGCAGEMMSGSP